MPEKPAPYLKKQIALAYQIRSFAESYKTKSAEQLCKYIPLTKSRICKILKTLNLAPKIQEEIIFCDNPALSPLTERDVHKIMLENNWGKQYEMWDKLKQNLSLNP
jgi:hypothetical protein